MKTAPGKQYLVFWIQTGGKTVKNLPKAVESETNYIIIWLRLTRTGNYQIHEFDRGQDFPIDYFHLTIFISVSAKKLRRKKKKK